MNGNIIGIILTLCLLSLDLQTTLGEPVREDQFTNTKPEGNNQPTIPEPEGDTNENKSSFDDENGDALYEEKIFIDELKNQIQTRFLLKLEEGTIFFWKVVNNTELVPTDDRAFKSEESYVIAQVMRRSSDLDESSETQANKYCNIYYWIGKHSFHNKAGDTAVFAVMLNAAFNSSAVNIYRELEGKESSAFKAIFEQDAVKSTFEAKPSKNVEEKKKRIFLVKGKDDGQVRIKEVKLNLHYYTQGNDKCIVLNSRTVFVHCGKDTSMLQKIIAKELAKMILWTKENRTNVIILPGNKLSSSLSQNEIQIMVQFFLEFEFVLEQQISDFTEYKAEDIRKIFDMEEERVNDLTVIRIHKEENGVITKIPVNDINAPISSLMTGDCYVIDTCNDEFGLLVWIGTKSGEAEREGSARKAELLLSKKEYNPTTPITYIGQKDVGLPADEFEIKDLIYIMKRQKKSEASTSAVPRSTQ